MKKILMLVGILAVAAVLSAELYFVPFTITTASVDTGGAGAAALAVEAKSLTIRADSSNAGAVCIGGASVTCQAAIATAATDGFKLLAGDAVTISDTAIASGTLYLNNTSANDYVSYIALN